MKKTLSLTEFQAKFQLKTNFLEYGGFCKQIQNFLRYKDFPQSKTPLPRNSYLNIIANKDRKGVSNLYRTLQGRHYNIIEENCEKWNTCDDVDLIPSEISKSFKRHSTLIPDTYAKYVQFRTLHQRFFTNDRLHKMGIKDSPLCNMCETTNDSNAHMILYCEKSIKLWSDVERWINQIGVPNYTLTANSIITGDIQKLSNFKNYSIRQSNYIFGKVEKQVSKFLLFQKFIETRIYTCKILGKYHTQYGKI